MLGSMSNEIKPTSPAERIEILDILRGFALFGVLIMNIINFSGYDLASETTHKSLSTYDYDNLLIQGARVLFDGKFYTLFSILFGIGFSIIMTRLKSKTDQWKPIFYQRLIVLAVIGYLHLQFFWSGDILLVYALTGLLLPLFANLSDKHLILISLAMLFAALAVDTFNVIFEFVPGAWLERIGEAIDAKNGISDDNWRTYAFDSSHSWTEFWHWVQPGPLFRLADLLNTNRFFKVLSFYLAGYYIGRSNYLAEAHKYKLLFKKLLMLGFSIGIPLNMAYLYFYEDGKQLPESYGLFDSVTHILGILTLCLGYIGGLALLWVKGFTWLKLFAPMGRMALTNYLMQTVICILLFYCIGFALGGRIGPSVSFPIAFSLVIFQMWASRVWLEYFNYGPMEWGWRKLTYHKF